MSVIPFPAGGSDGRYPAGVAEPVDPEEQRLVDDVRARRAELAELREQERKLLNDLDEVLRDREDIIRRIGLAEFGRRVTGDREAGAQYGDLVRKTLGPERSRQT